MRKKAKKKTGFQPVKVKPTKGSKVSKVSVAEHEGRVEVILEMSGERVRLLGNPDGIHIGTPVAV